MTVSDGPAADRRVVVLDVVGLQSDHLGSGHAPNLTGLLDEEHTADLRPPFPAVTVPAQTTRSEERRVGKECFLLCRSRWSPYH